MKCGDMMLRGLRGLNAMPTGVGFSPLLGVLLATHLVSCSLGDDAARSAQTAEAREAARHADEEAAARQVAARAEVARQRQEEMRRQLPWSPDDGGHCADFKGAVNQIQQRNVAARRERALKAVRLKSVEGKLARMDVDLAGYPFITVAVGDYTFSNTMGNLISPDSSVHRQLSGFGIGACVRVTGRVTGVAFGAATRLNEVDRITACSHDLAFDFRRVESCDRQVAD
jgi:hypothetical protein